MQIIIIFKYAIGELRENLYKESPKPTLSDTGPLTNLFLHLRYIEYSHFYRFIVKEATCYFHNLINEDFY